MSEAYLHPMALVETENIGVGTYVWAFAHIMKDVTIGNNCNIGDHVFIESNVRVGNGVTIKNGVSVWEGVQIDDFSFIGPNVAFTNDRFPRSPRLDDAKSRYGGKSWLSPTIVSEGVSIGANATILCGLTLGKYCVVGAGSVVTRDVPPYRLVYGCPARMNGYVNKRGEGLKQVGDHFVQPVSGKHYLLYNDAEMRELTP